MHTFWTLLVYAVICMAASLVGGWVPIWMRLTHRRMQLAISFVSGIVLGIGLLHLLPHSFMALGSIDVTVLWVLAGFLFMFFLERFLPFHHHDAPEEGQHDQTDDGHHGHGHATHVHPGDHAHDQPLDSGAMSFPWIPVAIGLTLHALIDGLALAAAVLAEASDRAAILAGIGTCLAVALHKPFDSLTIGTLMAAAGRSPASRHVLNALYSLVTPLGILLFFALAPGHDEPTHGLGQTLGFAAGAFLCIASSDLLPELQFHHHDRVTLSAALAAGLLLAWGTVFLESKGHDHFHAPGGAHTDHDGQHEEHEH